MIRGNMLATSRPSPHESRWLVRHVPRPEARLRLLCIPCAGAGAVSYRAWAMSLPEEIELITVQLPGRESRLREAPLRSAQAVAREIAPLVLDEIEPPLAIFGHSMGSVIAFELAHALEAIDASRLVHLFVSARGAPHIPVKSRKYALSDADFHRELAAYGGTPESVLSNRPFMQALLPAIRADFEITEAYEYACRPKLRCPITVFGAPDDRLIPAESMAPWRHETSAACNLHWIDGGHFFVRSKLSQVLGIVLATLGIHALG